jgi:hypothetical protein
MEYYVYKTKKTNTEAPQYFFKLTFEIDLSTMIEHLFVHY